MRVEDIPNIEAVLPLLDGWRADAATAGVELRNIGVMLPAVGDSTWHHYVNFAYNDTGMETTDAYWEIQPSA